MQRKRIKVCGFQTLEDIRIANETGIDFAGFIFAKSKRQIDLTHGIRLKMELDKKIQAVGVFMNSPLKDILFAVDHGGIQWIQLHGEETEEMIYEIKKRVSCTIIKAVPLTCVEMVKDMEKEYSCADYLLFDSFQPGAGVNFPWKWVEHCRRPFFLAGGIKEKNITEAIATSAFCLDIASGSEEAGRKSKEKIEKLVKVVHQSQRYYSEGNAIW